MVEVTTGVRTLHILHGPPVHPHSLLLTHHPPTRTLVSPYLVDEVHEVRSVVRGDYVRRLLLPWLPQLLLVSREGSVSDADT